MSGVDGNPEEVMLRKFFQGKLEWVQGSEQTDELVRDEAALCLSVKDSASVNQDNEHLKSEKAEKESDHTEGEEDVYTLNLEDIYDTVDENCSYNSIIQNRPPAPLPRPDPGAEPEKPMIFRGSEQSLFPPVHQSTDFIKLLCTALRCTQTTNTLLLFFFFFLQFFQIKVSLMEVQQQEWVVLQVKT